MRFNQNSAPAATVFWKAKLRVGTGPIPYRVLSTRAMPVAQLHHQTKGFLAIGVGHRFKRRIAAKRGVTAAVGLGKLTPRVGLHIAPRDAESIVEQDAKHELAFGLAVLGRAQQPRRS